MSGSETEVDVTQDYKHLLKDISSSTELPVSRIIIEEYPCGEDCIFDKITYKWYGYVSEYI